jgi:PKD repeat protein
MKKSLLLFMFACCSIFSLQAQEKVAFTIPSNPSTTLKMKELDEVFNHYQLFPLDTKALYNDLNRQGNTGYTDIFVDGEKQTLSWANNEFFTPNFKLVGIGEDGRQTVVPNTIKTFGGVLKNNAAAVVAITVTEDYLGLMIKNGDTYYYIEPAERYNASAAGLYVMYKNTDLKKGRFECAHQDMLETSTKADDGIRAGNCYRVQWAVAGDFGLYQKYSSDLTKVGTRISTVYNNVQVNYTGQFTHDYKFKMEKIIVSTCNNCINVSSSTDVDAIISTFSSFGNGGGFGTDTDYDLASFWSNRDFTSGGGNGVVGYASVGAVCSSARYQIIEDRSLSDDEMRVTVAHETGHNFSMNHDANGTIMAPVVNITSSWGAPSKSQLNGFVASLLAKPDNCLSLCPAPNSPPVTDFKWNPSATCVGKPVLFEDNSENDPTSFLWTFTGGSPATSTLKKPTVTYNQKGTYDVSLKATNVVGTVAKDRSQIIFVDSIKTGFCTPPSTPANTNAGVKFFRIGDWSSASGGASFDGSRYMDYTCSRVATLSPNQTYDAEIAVGDCEASINETFRIWIDYNNDGDFNDVGEDVTSNNGGGCGLFTSTNAPLLSINIPANVVQNRIVRCRVMSLKSTTTSQPCLTDLNIIGQVEDYGIIFKQQYSLSTSKKDVTCYNTATGSIKLNIIGGVKPYTYVWDKAGLIGDNPKNLVAGTYSVTVTDFTGATLKKSTTILQTASGVVSNITKIDGTCEEKNAEVVVYAGGGSGVFTYTWGGPSDSKVENSMPGSSSGITVTNVGAGTYNVTITDGVGCVLVKPVVITTTPAPKLVVTKDTVVCNGKMVTLTASGADSYFWDTGATVPSFTFTPNQKLTFYVTGKKGDCVRQDSVTVDVGTIAATISTAKTVCEGSSVSLTAGGGDSYTWSTGQTGATINVTPTASSTITCLVKNGGCKETKSVAVTVTPNAGKVTPSQTSTCVGKPVTIKAENGVAYLWNDGKTTPEITVTPTTTTTYVVTITAAGGCVKVIPTTITVGDIQAAVTSSATAVCAGKKVTLTAAGGSTYLWGNGAGTTAAIDVTPTATTVYSVTVSAANGCSKVIDTSIKVNGNPATPSITPNSAVKLCEGEKITLAASGGATTYVWSNGATTQNVVIDKTGNYTVKVTNADGCESAVSAAVAVTVTPLPAIPTITVAGNNLTSSATTGNQWYLNGAVIPGATAQTYTVAKSGKYSVKVTAGAACTSSSTEINVNKVGVENLENAQNVLVFPNPATDLLNIEFKEGNGTTHTMLILDALGQKIYSNDVTTTQNKYQINTSNWAKGIYFINFIDAQQKVTGVKKFTKM